MFLEREKLNYYIVYLDDQDQTNENYKEFQAILNKGLDYHNLTEMLKFPQTTEYQELGVLFDAIDMIIKEAFLSRNSKKIINFIKKALLAYPDNIGLLFLNSLFNNRKIGFNNLLKAIEIGDKLFPTDKFNDQKRPFWFDVTTRMYCRCIMKLTLDYLDIGMYDNAIFYGQKLLKLSKHDKMNVRYALYTLYLIKENYKAYTSLRSSYKDDKNLITLFADFTYKLMRNTRTPIPSSIIEFGKKLYRLNPNVLDGLLDKLDNPVRMVGGYSIGSTAEVNTFYIELSLLYQKCKQTRLILLEIKDGKK